MSGIPKNRYPVYVLSKGRFKSCLTAKMLMKDGVPFYLVVEPQEYNEYRHYFPDVTILVLPPESSGKGAIPVRNWIWEHSRKKGHKRHWILDDNIRQVYRWYNGKRIPSSALVAIKVVEDFTDRYTNIGISGLMYAMFAINKMPPLLINCHVYSFMLIQNDMNVRWRGEWNSDTDLCLQVIHIGLCTVDFTMFLCDKVRTMTMKGGNTDRYQGDGRTKMALSLYRQWPKLVKVYWRWGRWQHYVNWQQFRTKLIKRKDIDWSKIPKIDEYGMVLNQKKEVKNSELKKLVETFNKPKPKQ